jgi:hypothetical protein
LHGALCTHLPRGSADLPLGELPADHIINLKLIEWLAHPGQHHDIRTSWQGAASTEENH